MTDQNLLANIVLVITNVSGKIIFLNQAGEEILGHSSLVSGKNNFWDLFKTLSGGKETEGVFSFLESSPGGPGEFRLRT